MASINADLGLKWFAYRGSNIKTTREFCLHMTKKEYIHESEFETVLSGNIDCHQCRIYERTGLPQGLIEGTTPENFPTYRGGWNCQHGLYPVPEIMVPKKVREKLEKNATFAENSEKDNKLINRGEYIKEARAKFDSYDTTVWRKDYFDDDTGGYIVTDFRRIEHAQSSKNEMDKFQREWEQALVYVKNGHRIEFLKEGSRISLPDVRFDGVLADLKRTSSHNNIAKYAKKATREQNAEIVLFQFDNETERIYKELFDLKEKYGIKAYYFYTGGNKIYTNY
jgi:hypothetical protein